MSGQKVTQYLGVMQTPGAGTAWSLNSDCVRGALPGGPNSFGGYEGSGYPGVPGAIGRENGTICYELDFTNWDADSSPGRGAFTVGEYVHAQGSFTSLSALYFDAHMAPGKSGWDAGIYFNGDNVVAESTYIDATRARSSLTVLNHHDIGLNTSQANKDMKALVMREGQSVCFAGIQNCLSYQGGRLSLVNASGKKIFSLDQNGNAKFSGHVTQDAGPIE